MQMRDYIPFARRWVPIAFVLAVICGAGAYGISKWALQPAYTATSTMQVSATGLNVEPIYAVTLAQTYAAVAEQKPIVNTGLRAATGKTDAAAQKRILADQSPSTSCQTDGATALFSCSITANSAPFAAKAADAVARAFIRKEGVWQPSFSTGFQINVVAPASPPSSPSSPHPTLNGLVAVFLVFLLTLTFGLVSTKPIMVSPTAKG
jgi:capsular polysaccharide biosynthesis protein